jgi:uncharacterized protein (DUF1015 family)
MPEIQAFRGIRYNLGQVGALGDVTAPPYDCISPELQDALYRRHPCNVVRLILNRIEPAADDEANNRYRRAARFYKQWREQGVLFTEGDPAVYVYHQRFAYGGREYTRRGFMARVRLERFGEGMIFPHEQTMRGPKLDRLMLTAVCKANLSQVFGLFPDSQGEVQPLLDAATEPLTPVEATDDLGVVHRMWPVTDVATIAALTRLMAPEPVFIADGHHRYETACDYRDQVRDSGALRPDHPANYVLMTCVAMDDPGLIVLPTHRLFRDLPPLTSEQLAARLGDCFQLTPAGGGPDAGPGVWEEIELEGDQGLLGLYTQADQRWSLARITDRGRARLAEVSPDHGEPWQALGVSILHRLLVETLLCPPSPPETTYVHRVEEVVENLRGGQFPLAALLMPATVAHVRTISMSGERLPPKSTYFYPKLLSGLVINPLE